MTRENGYYWVSNEEPYYQIAEWIRDNWFCMGNDQPFKKDYFKFVDPHQIKHSPLEDIINDKIDAWHKSKSKATLREYLGMSREEYTKFIIGRRI